MPKKDICINIVHYNPHSANWIMFNNINCLCLICFVVHIVHTLVLDNKR